MIFHKNLIINPVNTENWQSESDLISTIRYVSKYLNIDAAIIFDFKIPNNSTNICI